ncbi:MobC family plasmid mobilization relaxosome protein [Nocardia brasiliensis]|uniref:MobC family plasmid mobilization relaxosome protein n=1 Tax=Nocardia brasiliensis TaxID=37326 RepID=UPI0018939ED2|nr:MobC family plasmid mobilization relaxosome protein [Nocardia brasiliensis]MBF6548857.1 MobC family plasmid mobilization relaxosome protein [Nocardia brasiliensis]
MGVVVVEGQGSAAGSRRSQQIAREERRRRRPNIVGPKRTVQVVLSEAEYEAVRVAAENIPSTVPWFLVESALPGAGSDEELVAVSPRRSGRGEGPWLPWAKRKALSASLLSAARSLHEVRLSELAHVGANLNQIARVANTHGAVDGDELGEVLADLRELIADLAERAAAIEELSRQAVRR